MITDVSFSGIDVFNYNYDPTGNKATNSYIPLFGEGATANSGDLPNGFAIGCVDCYAYAGITLKFRRVYKQCICVSLQA